MFIYPKGCCFNSLDEIKGKRITVMGLGLNGGGEATVRFLLKYGAKVLVTDMKSEAQLKPTLNSIAYDSSLDKTRLTYVLGEHRKEDFRNADCVIKNPGVKIQGNPFLAEARAIETDISLFLRFTKSPIIAVTGSKGKSSTVSAIQYGLKKFSFNSFLGGNITVSPLTFLEQTSEDTPVILELSSWQLADLRGRGILKPKIALITKIVPDHQNWYEDMGEYVADKRLIYADQDENDFTICDADSDEIGTGPAEGGTWGDLFAKETRAKVLRYSQDKLEATQYGVWLEFDEQKNLCAFARIPGKPSDTKILGSVNVPGRHMRQNAMNAALVLYLMGCDAEKIQSVIGEWNGIPHRLQYFHSWKNSAAQKTVRFYNDSCSTVPEAAAAASQAFGKPVAFITGGTDKGLDFSVLADALDSKKSRSTPLDSLYLLAGNGTDILAKLLDERSVSYKGPFASLQDLLQTVKADFETGECKSDTIVFSPGATSFGMFSNEFERGEKFMDCAKNCFENQTQ